MLVLSVMIHITLTLMVNVYKNAVIATTKTLKTAHALTATTLAPNAMEQKLTNVTAALNSTSTSKKKLAVTHVTGLVQYAKVPLQVSVLNAMHFTSYYKMVQLVKIIVQRDSLETMKRAHVMIVQLDVQTVIPLKYALIVMITIN